MDAELSDRDEARMIASILAGDTEQYHELIRPYERSVYKMALSFMKNECGRGRRCPRGVSKGLSKACGLSRTGEVQHLAHQHHIE